MRLDANTQEKYYDLYWNKIENCTGDNIDLFVRDYLIINKVTSPNLKNLYFYFKDYAKKKDSEELLKDMLHYAEIYHDIKRGKIGSEASDRSMKYLELLDASYAYTFLMTFIDKCRSGKESIEELDRVMSVLETYIFRRMICDLPTSALNKIFPILDNRVELLKGDSKAKYSDVLVYQLQSYAQSGSFPKDEEFKACFIKKDCYHMRKNNRMYLFDKLENRNSKEKNNVLENMDNNNYTVEHIMPQTLTDEWRDALGESYESIYEDWLHTIANLTITAYNSTYSNATFEEKKTCPNGFKESGLRINAELLDYQEWTETELKDRQNKLLELALNLWSYPITEFEPPKRADKEDISLADDVSFTSTKLKSITINDFEIKEDEWAKATVKFLQHIFELKPEVLYKEVEKSTQWFTKEEKNDTYRKIADGVWFCTQSETNRKISQMRDIAEKAGIDLNEITISIKGDNDTKALSAIEEKRIKFWQRFSEVIEEYGYSKYTYHTSVKSVFKTFSSGIGGVYYQCWIYTDCMDIELKFNKRTKEENQLYLNKMKAHKEEIEAEFGDDLIWVEVPHYRMRAIRKRWNGGGVESEGNQLEETIRWGVEKLKKLDEATRKWL